MALFVDSAHLADVAECCAQYPVAGITTNPSIFLAAAERGQQPAPSEVLRRLLTLTAGSVFAQPTGASAEAVLTASERYLDLDPQRIVLKLPMTAAGLEASVRLRARGARFSFTATYTLPQAYCGAMAGAEWIIPYFGRLRRAGYDPAERIAQMARLLEVQHCPARILVASIKTGSDLIEATLAGAHDVTLPPDVLMSLIADPLTAAAITQFEADAERMRTLVP